MRDIDYNSLRREFLGIGLTGAMAGLAGCNSINVGSDEESPNIETAGFKFSYDEAAKQVQIEFIGGAAIDAGNVRIQNDAGREVLWAELGSTTAGVDEDIEAGAVAVLGPNILNWGTPIEGGETIRVIYTGKDTPATLTRYTPNSEEDQTPEDDSTTPEDGEYSFEKVLTNWSGSASTDDDEYITTIQTDGSSTAHGSPSSAQIVRTEGRTTLPQKATFEIQYTNNTVQNNMAVGLSTRDGDDTGVSGAVNIVNAEPAVDPEKTNYYTLTVSNGNDWWDADSFEVSDDTPTFEVEYDGTTARGYYNGTEIGALEVDIETPLYGRISLEDDPDTTTGDTVRLLDYSES